MRNLELKTREYENAVEIFNSALNSERIWWSTIVLVIVGLGIYFSYTSVEEKIKGVEEEFREMKDEMLDSRADLSKNTADIYRSQGNYTLALFNRIAAISFILEKDEIGEIDKHNMNVQSISAKKDLEMAFSTNDVALKVNYDKSMEKLNKIITKCEGDTRDNLKKIQRRIGNLDITEEVDIGN